MPVISKFLGITIFMLYNEHNPPHIHAEYGEFQICVEINSRIVKGRFPPRALRLLLEWVELNEPELLMNWKKAQASEELIRVKPLE